MNSQLNPQSSGVRLVIADVDGTLVTQDKVLTSRAKAVVKKLQGRGHPIRHYQWAPSKGNENVDRTIATDRTACGFNGGVVVNTDLVTLSEHLLPADMAAEAVGQIADHGLDIFLYSDTDWFVRDANAAHVAREASTVQFHPLSFLISIR